MLKSEGPETPDTPAAIQLYGALAVGVLSVSSAAILIRLTPAPPAAIAFWRLFLTSLILSPVLFRAGPRKVSRRQLAAVALSGTFLALHFIFWIRSLSLLPVALSTALVSTHPLMLALSSRMRRRRPLASSAKWGLALLGAGLMALPLAGLHGVSWTGVADALAGAVFAGLYLLAGSHARRTLSATQYSWGTYTAAGLLLAVIEMARQHNLGPLSPHLLVLYLLMAVIPTLGGHTVFNWLLRWVPAPRVSLTMVGEIPGSAVLAWLVLHQVPSWPVWLSLGLITAGIAASLHSAGLAGPEAA